MDDIAPRWRLSAFGSWYYIIVGDKQVVAGGIPDVETARLFLAARELKDALMLLVGEFDDSDDPTGAVQHGTAAVVLARGALAKAEGRA